MSDIEDEMRDKKNPEKNDKKGFFLWELLKFVFKKGFVFVKFIYVNYFKGKYITVGSMRIPRILIAVSVLAVLYAFIPSFSGENIKSSEISEEEKVQKDPNTYDNEGIKIYDMRRCELKDKTGACGYLENYGEANFERIKVMVTFFASEGTAIYKGGNEAENMEAHTRVKLEIPCPDEFSYFEIKEVKLEGKTLEED